MVVRSYVTGETLEGTASEGLAEASAAEGPVGAVDAYRDDEGVWQYVREDRAADERARGRRVCTVYVELDPRDEDMEQDTAYGRTFAQWLRAAERRDSASEYDLRAAWRAGEEPSEYRL
jgi:hypothetical protein